MANLLQHFQPDAPRETGLLVAAASAALPAVLGGYVVQGMDATMAFGLAAASFASLTAFTLDACEYVAGGLATRSAWPMTVTMRAKAGRRESLPKSRPNR